MDDPAARGAGEELTGRLAAQPHVSAVTSYWTDRAAELRSRDGHAAMLVAHVAGEGRNSRRGPSGCARSWPPRPTPGSP